MKQKTPLFGVILAGGSGTRFWPRSRQSSPKQLCKITDAKQTMLEQTLQRLDGFIPVENRLIVTHQKQAKTTRLLTKASCAHLLAEPEARNTSAALALAVLEVLLLTGDDKTVMVSLHSDHVIQDLKSFQNSLSEAADLAAEGYLSLVGIVPRTPDTGFGYIERGDEIRTQSGSKAYRVKSFWEKPNAETARRYLATQRFYWNSGIFVWQLRTIAQEFAEKLPNLWQPLYALYTELKAQNKTFADLSTERLGEIYKTLPEIAIDNGILEKSSNIVVGAGDFGWNDVGTWTALNEVLPTDASGNLTQGDSLLLESKNCIVANDDLFVATYGVQDLIVVVDKGCVLVCPKDKAQGIKSIVAKLKEMGRDDLI